MDELPRGPVWECEEFSTITGDVEERVSLWKRNACDLVKELIGNPAFRGHMRYTPEKLYEDEAGRKRLINEMWTADLWHDLQVSGLLSIHRYRDSPDTRIKFRTRTSSPPLFWHQTRHFLQGCEETRQSGPST